MYVGIDLGTSGVKVVLLDAAQHVVDQQTAGLEVSLPHPRWSEQLPEDWWSATTRAIGALRDRRAHELSGVRAIGLSGQMHGATLLDAADQVLRPAILWNDGRSEDECGELERREPRSREITGNLAMPGFTAPKLLWVAGHEPEIFARVARVLLPKDWLRLRMTGEAVSEMSDAAGTLWLDVGARAWSPAMLAATRLDERAMPSLIEGSAPSGRLRDAVADAWGMPRGATVAGGAGDQAAGAVGVGVVAPGQAFLSLGTSGVYFAASDRFAPNPERAVHAFCHCLPGRWHQMSVILSAAACLSWVADVCGARDEDALLTEIAAGPDTAGQEIFLPYLSGERTPHNDPYAKGVFFGLSHTTGRASLGRAVLEGVAFALADAQDALIAGGAQIERVFVIGGGARSALWGDILASVLGRELDYATGADLGPALGAARLAILADRGAPAEDVCKAPAVARTALPRSDLAEVYARRRTTFRRLYADLRETFRAC